MTQKVKLGITQGDYNGVSYEVILKTFSDARMMDHCTPILYGNAKLAAYHKKLLPPSYHAMEFTVIAKADQAADRQFNIIDLTDKELKIDIGLSTELAGEQSRLALERACKDLKSGAIDVLVTAPVNKKNIQSDSFVFPGHTEYLSQQFGAESLMMMCTDRIRIGIVTNHLALREVPDAITAEVLMRKIHIMHDSLVRDFGIPMPKIAVLALDPHAGDFGVIGNQDMEVVKPAIDEAYKEGILVYGPYPSDGFFGSAEFNHFDGVLALYHDQGLIPFKLMSFTSGVNYTAGLPIIRTSPAHGTGYDIAGKDKASEQSFRNAVYLALDILDHRKEYDELTQDPLQ